MNHFNDEHQTGLMLLRLAVLFSFFTGAAGVLIAISELFVWIYFLNGGEIQNPDVVAKLIEWNDSKIQFLLLNLYHLILWNAVIILTIWLFRLHEWARKTLGYFLGFDMIFTVALLFWFLYWNHLDIDDPGLVILMNTIQVAVIVLLSHPEVVRVTQTHDALRKTLQQNQSDGHND